MKCLSPYLTDVYEYKTINKVIIQRKKTVECPCGKCILCVTAKANEWALRINHELENKNLKRVTITSLTYNNENVPKNYSLRKEDIQLFMKRLRINVERKISKERARKLKYFICGEYGGKYQRPHYHALIMGLDPTNKTEMTILYNSWGKGYIYPEIIKNKKGLGSYVTKYLNKSAKPQLYFDRKEYEKKASRQVPFKLCSQGLGKNWALQNAINMLKNACIKIGQIMKSIPRQYIKWIEKKTGMDTAPILKIRRKEYTEKILKKYEERGFKREERISKESDEYYNLRSHKEIYKAIMEENKIKANDIIIKIKNKIQNKYDMFNDIENEILKRVNNKYALNIL